MKTDEEQTVSGLGDFSDSFGFPIRVGRLRHRRRLPDGHPHLRRHPPLLLPHRKNQRFRISKVRIDLTQIKAIIIQWKPLNVVTENGII
jgi:hypothetical protein